MRKVGILVAGAAVLLTACPNKSNYVPRSSGSIGLTSDDAVLYVADADHHRVTVIDTATMTIQGHIDVGFAPERILIGPNDEVYVSNRGERTVMRIDPGTMAVAATGQVGGEPVGMTVSEDGALLVANSTSGTLTILDSTTLAPEGEIHVGGTPWAVTALPGNLQAYVTDLLSNRVTLVDTKSGTVVESVEIEHEQVDDCWWGESPARTANQPADVVISPEGDRAYVAHVLSRTGTDGSGNASLSLAVAPAVSTIQTSQNRLLSAPANSDPADRDYPAPLLVPTDQETCFAAGGDNMDAPSSLVVDSTGEWIYVADHNSNAVAIISARGRQWPSFRDPELGIVDLVRVGARPTGLAVRGDLNAAYVHNAFDYSISIVERQGDTLVTTREVSFAESSLDAATENGRRLFYSAVDPRMTQPELGGVSCSSCHPNGRADGLSWVLSGETDPWQEWAPIPGRNTPALWELEGTAPYQWDGASPDLDGLAHVMVGWMGGAGISGNEATDILSYMQTIPAPDNPLIQDLPLDLVSRGETLFNSNCASCHAGAALTDGRSHVTLEGMTVDTPSLRGVFASPPYLHDGSARDLREALSRGIRGDATLGGHDVDRRLQADDLAALEAYLKTL